MYEKTFPNKRFKHTLEFLQKHISTSEIILDLGVPNPFSKIMQENGYTVKNTTGEDLDNNQTSLKSESYTVSVSYTHLDVYKRQAHNFGDVKFETTQSDILPSLATRIKNKLQIKNPKCVAYDILFGCPGWIEGVLQANAFIKSGMAKKCLVIGTETLSRVVDIHDRDSMIYSDGAGATVIEASEDKSGLLAYESGTYAYEEANYLFFGKSFNQDLDPNIRYIKMYGRKIYEFALSKVPQAMKECLDKSGVKSEEVKKILIHQANEKMDEALSLIHI